MNTIEQMASLTAKSEFEDDESALEALVQLKDVDFGEVYNNRVTSLDSDEDEGISISFSMMNNHNI